MTHRRWLLVGLLALAACGGDGAPAARPTVTAAAAGSPTAPGITEAPPTVAPSEAAPPATPPPVPAADPAVAVVFGQPLDGSVQAIDAGGERRILVDPTAPNQRVAWQPAPDGRTIAAVIFKGVQPKTGGYESAALWTVGVDATAPRKVLDLGAIGDGGLPNMNGEAALYSGLRRESWTADGRWIILPSSHEGQIDLYAVAADGGEIRRLTETPEFEFDSVVAPDGASVAYATTTTFGTGGGFGDPRAWVQPLFGEQRQLTEADPADFPGGVSVLGWLDSATPLALIQYLTDGSGAIWTMRDGAPDLLQRVGPGATWDLGPGQLVFTDSGSGNPKGAGALFSWRGEPDGPSAISDAASSAHLSPQPDRLLICEGDTGEGGTRTLWQAGRTATIDVGPCDNLAWSASGRLALGGTAQQPGAATRLIGEDGALLDVALPGAARIVGWHGETLYFFAPAGGDDWQLYLLDAAAAAEARPLGAPFAGQPSDPALVVAR